MLVDIRKLIRHLGRDHIFLCIKKITKTGNNGDNNIDDKNILKCYDFNLLNLARKQEVSGNSDPEDVAGPFFSDRMESSLTSYVDNADTRSL